MADKKTNKKSMLKAELIFVIIILLAVAIQIGFFFTKVIPIGSEKLSSNAVTVSTTGIITLCINYPPNISVNSCDTRAFVGYLYTCTPTNYDTDSGQNYTYRADTELFDINLTTGKINLTANDSQIGEYYINITAQDSSGCDNSRFSTFLNLTVAQTSCGDGYCTLDESCSACAVDCGACPATPTTSPGGGGGGGGTAIVPATQAYTEITPEKPAIFDVTKTNTAAIQLEISVKERVNGTIVTVAGPYSEEYLKNLSPSIDAIHSKAYQYLKVSFTNLKPEQISSLKITFRVEKNWLLANNFAKETVSLFGHNDAISEWKKLPTHIIREDSNFVYYQAQTTALGYYAIGVTGFETNTETVHVRLKQGQTMERQIFLKNHGAEQLIITFETEKVQDLLQIDEPEIILGIGETKTITLRYSAAETTMPGAYLGSLVIRSGADIKVIKQLIEVESKDVLFDISLEIPPRYQEIMPGQNLRFDAMIYSLKGVELTQVEIEYTIKDESGNVVLTAKEIIGVEKEASYTKTLTLPENILIGEYLLVMQARYKDSVGISTEKFKVVKEKRAELPAVLASIPGKTILIWLVLSTLIIIFGIIMYSHYRFQRLETTQAHKISQVKTMISHEQKKLETITLRKSQLNRQLSLLEHSYKSGYIGKTAYSKGVEKLKQELHKIHK